jgi:hypothetical protein
VDLGYVVNAGFSEKWGSNTDEDNQFAVKVLVQVTGGQFFPASWTGSFGKQLTFPPGADVMIFKIFSPKNSAKNGRF